MSFTRRAVIDIGTNSVKMLVADVNGRKVLPVSESSEQTRLGAGFYETHMLNPDAIQRTAEAIAKFASEASSLDAVFVRVIATSAARDAINQAELLDAVKRASGLAVDVISGEQEADWAFQGVASSFESLGHPLLILDIGGGSTEFILGDGTVQHFRNSFRLGSVRLLERIQPSDPPTTQDWQYCKSYLEDFLNQQIRPGLGPELRKLIERKVTLVGTGGTPVIMARMETGLDSFDREKIESIVMDREQIERRVEFLWSLPLEERKKVVGLPPNRADVILTGAAILAVLMKQFDFPALRVSTRGLRFAAVMKT